MFGTAGCVAGENYTIMASESSISAEAKENQKRKKGSLLWEVVLIEVREVVIVQVKNTQILMFCGMFLPFIDFFPRNARTSRMFPCHGGDKRHL